MDIAVSRNGKRVLNVWFAILLVFLYTPLALLLLFSFNDNNLPVFPLRGFTTQAYQDFAANTELRASVVTSAKIAAISSLGAVVLGLLAAIVLVRRRVVGKSAASALLLSPLVVPYIALAIGLLVFFNEVSVPLGFPTLVMGHVVLSIPYTILILVPRLERLDIRLEEAARDLGAGALQTFRLITLPLLLPALVSSWPPPCSFSSAPRSAAASSSGDSAPTWLRRRQAAAPSPAARARRRARSSRAPAR
jgi:spermidine/putrescine transport system permease protein